MRFISNIVRGGCGVARALLVALVLSGCAGSSREPADPAARVELLAPSATNEATAAYIKLARVAFPKVELVATLSRPAESGPSPVLLVVQPARLDPAQWPTLRQRVEEGTPVLFWGPHPWTTLSPATTTPAAWQPMTDYFDSPAARLRWLDNGETVPLLASVQSPLPQPLYARVTASGALRWLPLVETEDQERQALAWPASLWVETQPPARARYWGWLGLEAVEPHRKVVVDVLRQAVRRLQRGCFILPAEVMPAVLEGGQRLEVAIRVARPVGGPADARVTAELIEEGGRSVRRVSAAAQEVTQLNLGLLPRLPERHRDYVLRVKLESGAEQVLDQMDREFRVLAEAPPPVLDRIGMVGSGFTAGRRPFFVLGAELALPGTAPGVAAGEARTVLDPEVFEPVAVRRELQRAQVAGIQVLHVPLERATQVPALRWLLTEMRPLSLRLQLQVAGLDPLDLDLERGRALLEEARVADDPLIFALEVGGRPYLGSFTARRAWDAAWLEWLQEQYGSLAHAEQVWGQPVWLYDGQPCGPPDEALARAGASSPALRAYRRFVDDLISRRTGDIRRLLDALGWRALVGLRRGWGGPPEEFPLDAISGVVHANFISLDVDGLLADAGALARADHTTAYARGVGAIRPVLWRSVGAEAGVPSGDGAARQQAEQTQALLDAALRSHVAGVQVSVLAGGWRPRAGGDFGLTFADGRWRPAGDQVRRFNLRVRREVTPPPSWKDAVADRDADARGVYGWLMTHESGKKADEVRRPGWNHSTLDAPLTALGGAPFDAPGPWSALNAEWGALRTASQEVARVSGAPVSVPVRSALDVEVINTGSARWSSAGARRPGAIWVRVTREGAREQWLPVSETPAGQRAVVKWLPADPGRWEWRMWNWDRGGFGERLLLDVQ